MSYESRCREYEEKIQFYEKQMKECGAIHKRDLYRHVKRLKKELSEYKENFAKFLQKSP